VAKEKIRALFLGWEFPPFLTGGLGPATYGLAKALSPFIDLKIVLPRSDLNFRMKRVNIIGLNHFTFDEKKEELVLPDFKWFLAAENITEELAVKPPEVRIPYGGEAKGESLPSLFSDPDSYGTQLMQKVHAYADVAIHLDQFIDFDLIHAHDWLTFPAAVAIKENSEKPLVLHIHSLETDRAHPGINNETFEIEKEALMAADCVLPVSELTKQSIINHYHINPDKIFPVHNAIDPEPALKTLRSDNEKRVLFLGRITRQKGPKFLLETMKKLCAVMPGVKFYIAGTGDLSEALQREVEKAGLSEQTVFTGFVSREKVKELLSTCDVYFMPSVSEPFGLSALEATQFGLPCVISKQSGVSEVLHNVLKTDCWDTDQFANYLHAVLSYDGLRKTMVRLAQHDLNNISWDHSAREVLKAYQLVTAVEEPGSVVAEENLTL
jgi:hypothetical protein